MAKGNPHRFTSGQAVYNARGDKIGWVTKVEKDFMGWKDVDRATITDVAGRDVHYTTDHLKSGVVCNKAGLKFAGVTRASAPPVGIGARLFESPYIYIGTVVSVVHGEPPSQNYLLMTDLNRPVSHEKLRDGIVMVGRRKHVALP